MSKPRLRRAYDPPDAADGLRILVDRLWPRGLNRDAAKIDLWLKEIAPSTELRRWFGHDPEKWPEFQRRYARELEGNPAMARLRAILAQEQAVTLLFAAKDISRNNAVVLRCACRQA
jgi:uncharacterized protein YeaO (DUF488 family)